MNYEEFLNHDPHIETRMEGDAPTPATVEQAAKEYANEKHGFDYWKKRCEAAEAYIKKYSQKLPDGPEFMDWQNTIEPEPEGSYREGWVSEAQVLKEKIKMLEEMKDWAEGSMDNGATGDEILYSHNDFFSDMDTWIKKCEDRLLEITNIPQPPKTDK